MWTGAESGVRASGGVYRAICPGCRVRLIALDNIRDKSGNVRNLPDDYVPTLEWNPESA